MLLSWFEFILCSMLIVFCGHKLSHYGDIIAEKTGMGRTWIGVVLMATVTSLPELATGLSSVTFAGVPDIAVGDVLGSCVFNMLILAILDAIYRPMPISTKAHQGHILAAGFGILLLGIVCISLALDSHLAPLGWIGPSTLLVIAIYFAAIRMIYHYEKKRIAAFIKERAVEMKYEHISMRSAAVNYAVNAAGVIMAAVFLPAIGAKLAEQTGLGQSFVGNILIAVSTSLPEVVVSISAVKIDAIDLAIGNLLGSNIFNIFILALDDMFFTQGPLLSVASHTNMFSALSAIVMTVIAVISLTYRAERKMFFLGWDSIGIVLMYIVNIMLLYMFR
jgi:cation:H+ antiporter